MDDVVTKQDVAEASKALGIRDWSTVEGGVTAEEAEAIRQAVGGEALEVPIEDFATGLEVELEHGTRFADSNVTQNHPVLTGKIVLAHLKEDLLYYRRLLVAELEGDLFRAGLAGDGGKCASLTARLSAARAELSAGERAALDKAG